MFEGYSLTKVSNDNRKSFYFIIGIKADSMQNLKQKISNAVC